MIGVCHVDGNFYYGNIEQLFRPEIRGKAFVVGGNQHEGDRHGIVLTKSPLAKKFGIKTGVSIMEARKYCPELIVLPPNYPLYLHFSRRMREIALRQTSVIECFGLDEFWGAVSGDRQTLRQAADTIRQDIFRELGITVSVGISFCKIFAKLGSDLAANNAVYEVWQDDFKEKVWPLPASDLLNVGPATTEKLKRYGIRTIGALAQSKPEFLCRILHNKGGEMLWVFANGLDTTPVIPMENEPLVKSVGNSWTCPRDLVNDEDVRAMFYMLGESVATRMREGGFEAKTLQISIKDNGLYSFERQQKLPRPTNLIAEMIPVAMEIFRRNYAHWPVPIRSLGIKGTDLIAEGSYHQISLFEDETKREKTIRLERATDRLRGRYGYFALQRAILMRDRHLTHLDAKTDNTIHPVSYTYNA